MQRQHFGEENVTITVLDPTPGTAIKAAPMAPPVDSLEGRTIGLLDNGKFNVARYLDHVEETLRSRYDVKEVVRRRKPNQNAPAAPAMLTELATCDAVLSAVGD